jgi:sodium/bile acid cotransporter 7
MNTACVLLVLVTLAGCSRPPASDDGDRRRIAELYDGYRKQFPDVPGISPEQLAERLDDPDLVVVDVRDAREREVSTLPGALSTEEFLQGGDELEGRRVVTYCTVGYRSGLFAEELRAKGWDVANLEGSILGWTHAGGELVDREGRPTRRVHVYARRWNLAAEGYEPVW